MIKDSIDTGVAALHPEAAVVVPPRSTAVPSSAAETAPTQRNHHLRCVAEHGRTAWRKASGPMKRARAEAAMSRFKRLIGDVRRTSRFDGLRSRTDRRRATEVDVAVYALNRMSDLDPNYVRTA